MRRAVTLAAASALSLAAARRVDHIVYVMLENHAYDNMIGWLPQSTPLTTSFCNDYEGVHACASTRGAYEDPDPDHSVSGTAQQLYGTPEPPAEHDPASVTLSGFVASYAGAQGGNASRGAAIMDMMAPAAVPVISALARAFTVVDRYHASVPGPTFPNRLFAMSGTSHGYGDNDVVMTARGWPQTSVFGRLDAIGAASRVYFSDVPSALLLADARNLSSGATAYKSFEADFAKDVAAGDLPPFTWVEPSYLDIPGIAATDEHPAHDVASGERFLKSIYEAVRAGPLWNSTVLLLTWDEHGGFADHVPPPVTGVVSPDGLPCVGCGKTPFSFTRLGVRVPMVVVSPWADAGRIVSSPPDGGSGVYEHASLPATLRTMVPGWGAPLTARDAAAPALNPLWEGTARTSPRTDCPSTLPAPPAASPALAGALRDGAGPVNDLQRSLLLALEGAARAAEGASTEVSAVRASLVAAGAMASEAAAGLYARARSAALLLRQA